MKPTFIVAFFLLLATLHSSESQVNFSPSWGKRTRTHDGNSGGVKKHQTVGSDAGTRDVLESFPPDTCTAPFDTIRRIQRLIQAEFQQMKLCDNFNPEAHEHQKIPRSS